MTIHLPVNADLTLPFDVLDRMMPMHVVVDADGGVRHMGPTIAKMIGMQIVAGTRLLELVDLRGPGETVHFGSLMATAGSRLNLALKAAAHLPLRGVIMPLPNGEGAILDISLGLSFARAVADFSLTLTDFSPCDQTVELLYLHEANSSTARLSRHLSERLQAAHASAEYLARTDALTGLPNRRGLNHELELLLSSPTHDFTLMNLDLDLFKSVNDTYGHAAGDTVLRAVARVLDGDLRRNDFSARIGGDEFFLILRPGLTPEQAANVALRLIQKIERPIRFEGVLCRISASVGIVSSTQYPEQPSAETMLAHADAALYRAKHDGRGRFALYEDGERIAPASQTARCKAS